MTLAYNDAGRLELVDDNSITIGTYTYNALGQRVKKVAGGQTTIFHYDLDGKLIAESGINGTFTKLYVYLEGAPLAMVDAASGSVYYYHTDHLGTPQKMTDGSSALVWEAFYRPFD